MTTECKHRFKTVSKRLKQYKCRICGKEVEEDLFCEDCFHCSQLDITVPCYSSSDGEKVVGTGLFCNVRKGSDGYEKECYKESIQGCDCDKYEAWK